MRKWTAAVILLGFLVAVAAYSQTVQKTGVVDHEHPGLVSRGELWEAAAIVIAGNFVLAVGLAWRDGKKHQMLLNAIKAIDRLEGELSNLRVLKK